MKSKSVASILRHVASKLPSADVNDAAPVETAEKETKRSRKARHAGNDDELPDDSRIPGTSANEEEKLEMLYETIAWPLGRKFGHPYDAFKLALTCVKWSVCAVMTMLTDMASQGAGLGVQPAGDADPTLDDTDPHEHHCEAIDAPAHQNSCRYRVDVLYARRHRRDQESLARRGEGEH